MRTNSDKTTLTIDAAIDTVKHYDVCGIVDVIKTANASYHEYGTVGYIENDYGHVVIESSAAVKTVVLTKSEDITNHPATLENKGGTITNKYSTTNEVASANNANANNVQLELAYYKADTNPGDILTTTVQQEDTTNIAATITTVVNNAKDEAATAAVSATFSSDSKNDKNVVRVGSQGYETLQEAFDAVSSNGQVIALVKDVSYNYVITYRKAYGVTFDLCGFTLKVTGGLHDAEGKECKAGRAIKQTAGTLTIQNGTIDGRSYLENGDLNPMSNNGSWSDTIVGGCFRCSGDSVKATLKNLVMYNNNNWGNAVKLETNATLDIYDCKINSVYGGGIEIGYGTGNIYRTVVNQSCNGTKSYISTCYACDYLGTMNLYNCEGNDINIDGEGNEIIYSEGEGVQSIYMYTSGGTINVYGGKYVGTNQVIHICKTNDSYGHTNTSEKASEFAKYEAYRSANNGKDAIINIHGGTFSGPVFVENDSYTEMNIYGGSFTSIPTQDNIIDKR